MEIQKEKVKGEKDLEGLHGEIDECRDKAANKRLILEKMEQHSKPKEWIPGGVTDWWRTYK